MHHCIQVTYVGVRDTGPSWKASEPSAGMFSRLAVAKLTVVKITVQVVTTDKVSTVRAREREVCDNLWEKVSGSNGMRKKRKWISGSAWMRRGSQRNKQMCRQVGRIWQIRRLKEWKGLKKVWCVVRKLQGFINRMCINTRGTSVYFHM